MVTVLKNLKSIRSSILYNERKVSAGEAKLIGEGWYGKELQDMSLEYKVQRLEDLASRNLRSKRPAVHVSLNFLATDQLKENQLVNIARDYLDRIGLQKQPFLVYQHLDVAHPHIHIVTTRIQPSGDRFCNKKEPSVFRAARLEIEKKYKLTPAQNRQKHERRPTDASRMLVPLEYGKAPTAMAISTIVKEVLATYKLTSLHEFKAVLRQFNVRANAPSDLSKIRLTPWVIYQVLREGKSAGKPITSKIIEGNPGLKNLETLFQKNKANRIDRRERLLKKLDFVLAISTGEAGFLRALHRKGISVILQHTGSGTLKTVTYIDNYVGVVFDGDELGHAYSAAALATRFGHFQEVQKTLKVAPTGSGKSKLYLSSAIPDRQSDQEQHLQHKQRRGLRI